MKRSEIYRLHAKAELKYIARQFNSDTLQP